MLLLIRDLVIGARFADPNGATSGASYVVFGKTSGFTSPLELSSLDGSTGFVLNGGCGIRQSRLFGKQRRRHQW